MRAPRIAAILLAAGLGLTGCGTSSAPVAAPRTSPGPTDQARVDALTAHGPTGGRVCFPDTRVGTDYGYRGDSLRASVPLTVTGTQTLVGSGVEVLGGLALPIVGTVPAEIAVDQWPVRGLGPLLRPHVAWRARTNLIGLHLAAHQVVLPVLHLRTMPGGHIASAQISYRADDGLIGATTVRAVLRFARGPC